MTIREEKIERYEEALFILWADEVALQEGRDLERENAALRLDANFRAPEEVVRRGRELISRKLAARTARSVGRRAWKFVHTAALVCLFTTLAFSAAFAASPTFRANTLNLVIETFDEGTRFSIASEENGLEFTVNWLPDELKLESRDDNRNMSYKEYQSSNGKCISIARTTNYDTTFIVDTEAEDVQHTNINENKAVISAKDENDIQIFIIDEKTSTYIYITAEGIGLKDSLRIAENIIF